jgi:diguanylate cyclase (GGDEF)-like protein
VARLGGLLFLSAGVLVLLTVWFPVFDGSDRKTLSGVSLAAMVIGVIIPILPWHRWDTRWYLAPVVVAFLLLGVGNAAIPGVLNAYQVIFVMAFAFVGLTQPPGTSLAILPLAALCYIVPELDEDTATALITFGISAPIWVIVGEVLSQSTNRLKEAERGAAQLLAMSTSLAASSTEEEVAASATQAASELLQGAWCLIVTVNPDSAGADLLGVHQLTLPLGRSWPARDICFRAQSSPQPIPSSKSQLMKDVLLDAPATQAILSRPLVIAQEKVGHLVIGWDARRPQVTRFSRRSLTLLLEETERALDRLREKRDLARDAETDALTGLANRRMYNKALDRVVPGDAVVLLDLDHFKQINDRMGHGIGDEVLVAFASFMSSLARRGDCIARYGGEEFAWVLAGAGIQGATATVSRLQRNWSGSSPVTTFSAGVAIHHPSESAAVTLARADAALYRAKEGGRNRIEVAAGNDGDRASMT